MTSGFWPFGAPSIHPVLTLLVAGGTGLCLGSFTVTAAIRALRSEQALTGRSRCDHCQATLSGWETAPLVSYCLNRGVCRRCKAPINRLHPVGEITGALVVIGAVFCAPTPRNGLVALIGLLLLAASVIDMKSRRLPDRITFAIALCGLALAAMNGLLAMAVAMASALVAFLVMEGLRRGFLMLRRRPGLGFGDVKLIAALALWLGLASPWMVVVASLVGLCTMVVLKPADRRIAFGPAIAIGAFGVGLALESGLLPAAMGGPL